MKLAAAGLFPLISGPHCRSSILPHFTGIGAMSETTKSWELEEFGNTVALGSALGGNVEVPENCI